MPYRIDYASTGRSSCKGPKPCSGSKIDKGEIRLGTVVEIMDHTGMAWKHWGCVSPRTIANIKKELDEPSDLDGYEDLRPEDQAKIDKAWKDGHIAEADAASRGHDPLNELTTPEAKAKCKEEDLPTTGSKTELVARLREHYGPLPGFKIFGAPDPLDSYTVAELKDKADEAQISKSGSKTALVARLREHYGPVETEDGETAKTGEESGTKRKITESDDEDRKPVKKERKRAAVKSEDESDSTKPKAKAKPQQKPAPKSKKRTVKKESESESELSDEEDTEESAQETSSEESEASSTPPPPRKKAKKAAPKTKPTQKGSGKVKAESKVKLEAEDEEEEETPVSRPMRKVKKEEE
ncbi:zf-parp-domain-containing protein [Phaffia rhodozyma]|uniref:Zf-parp-domain-containing protein n=1 Tax=Phaffia rhodozyma TaxID=264483 RepID=A0A0F7SHR2_PHARH|nr:zf-parp-domain-containing protein [Phaffia rhodozyma]